MKKIFAVFLFLPTLAGAELVWSEPWDFFIDPPEGWSFLDQPTPEHMALTDPGRKAVVQVFLQPPQAPEIEEAGDLLLRKLRATGEHALVDWNGTQTWLASLRFTPTPGPAKGWALIVPWKDQHLIVLAFSPENLEGVYSDSLNSTLNSLALGEDGRRKPGILSRYYIQTSEMQEASLSLTIAGQPRPVTYSPADDESARILIERESRILAPYGGKPGMNEAWARFYRQINREIYASLEPLAQAWEQTVQAGQVKPQDLPGALLSWLQGLEYDRKGGLSDLSTPWQTLKERKGDCDSRALIYAGLMDKFGYPVILMVSAVYAHGMAALDLPGPGARFSFQGRSWLVAELTAPVSLGQIAADKADPSRWLGIDLWGKP